MVTTSRTIDTPVESSWGLVPNLSKYKTYLVDSDSNYIYDNEWNKIVVYSNTWFEEVSGTQWNIQ